MKFNIFYTKNDKKICDLILKLLDHSFKRMKRIAISLYVRLFLSSCGKIWTCLKLMRVDDSTLALKLERVTDLVNFKNI
jgi:hypothetical protein